ncbi:unconventional prefoldin RPB5 interactor-like protein [Topomyia yanbarensis]|uniref:unconventional prefoldin RPB5 interactor-like protein n=1 Tax=Topomyia yanbarensis TaxID=2498891 RepID=UPI00273B8952|nr:unconventional prefoldin RPB5 interactor-like protein [Topomyia yanbarensis]XP_058828260.1 unconventional prefoldin RPB5 interactor-like protein [Topomyia yanbarensis]XP_058828261.1 unconventional prefoldin RPB5 interactor-like protein [Topomyia yanbarensis]
MDLYKKTYVEALANNEQEIEKWKTYRNEHQQVSDNLKMYQSQLKVDILIPIGSKAFLPGQLYHTGEVMTSHGSGYFSDCSVDQAKRIIDHRINNADKMLLNYEREKELFNDKLQMPFSEDAFGGHEIVEEYDEARENLWRQEHRNRMKEAKRREALSRQENRTGKDQDLFDRLEELELMEELEHEMNNLDVPIEDDEHLRKLMCGEIKVNNKKRMAHSSVDGNTNNTNNSSPSSLAINLNKDDEPYEIQTTDDESSNSSEESYSDVSSEFVKLLQVTKSMNKRDKIAAFKQKLREIDEKLRQSSVTVEEKLDICDLRYEVEEALDFLNPSWESQSAAAQDETDVSTKRKIKFSDTNSVKIIEGKESISDMEMCNLHDVNAGPTLELQVNHSPAVSKETHINDGDEIKSPVDIYRLFEHCLQKEDNVGSAVEIKSILKNRDMVLAETHHAEAPPLTKNRKNQEILPVDIIGDVIEHKAEDSIRTVSVKSRKVSRFKQQKR